MSSDGFEPGTTVAEKTFENVDPCAMQLATAVFRDSNPIHYDGKFAAEQGHSGRVNQGPLNASYVAQTAVSIASGPEALERLEVRYEAFVVEGDTVTATATVANARTTADGTVVDLELQLEKEDGTTALTGEATVRLEANGDE